MSIISEFKDLANIIKTIPTISFVAMGRRFTYVMLIMTIVFSLLIIRFYFLYRIVKYTEHMLGKKSLTYECLYTGFILCFAILLYPSNNQPFNSMVLFGLFITYFATVYYEVMIFDELDRKMEINSLLNKKCKK